MPTRRLRPTLRPFSVILLCGVVVLPACASRRPPPPRASPLATAAETFPNDGTLAFTSASGRAWVIETPRALELFDGDGLIAGTASAFTGWMFFDAAPDRTAALCTWDEIRMFDRGIELRTTLAEIAPDGEPLRCEGIATRGEGDVWVLLAEDPNLRVPSGLRPNPRICRHEAGAWSCAELDAHPRVGSLVATREHVWWLTEGALFALDATAPGIAPSLIGPVGPGTLRASARTESVLLVTTRGSTEPGVELVTLDGARSSFVTDSENGGYDDVWFGAGDRVLAVDVYRDGTTRCSSGLFSYSTGTSCSTTWHFTQLVVYELGAGAPVEVGHATYEGGAETTRGVERPDGTFMSGDRWYRVP